MNKKTMGEFIYELRCEKGMTQKKLAELLYVSDKAVSRWERDESMPYVTVLPEIARVFGITVDELLNGERNCTTKQNDNINIEGNLKKFNKLFFLSFIIICVGILIVIAFDMFIKLGFVGYLISCALLLISMIVRIICANRLLIYNVKEDEEGLKKYNNIINNKLKQLIIVYIGILCALLPYSVGYGTSLKFSAVIAYCPILFLIGVSLAYFIIEKIVIKSLITKGLYFINDNEKYKKQIKSLNISSLLFSIILIIVIITKFIVNDMTFVDGNELTFEEYKIYIEDGLEYEVFQEELYDTCLVKITNGDNIGKIVTCHIVRDDEGNELFRYVENKNEYINPLDQIVNTVINIKERNVITYTMQNQIDNDVIILNINITLLAITYIGLIGSITCYLISKKRIYRNN